LLLENPSVPFHGCTREPASRMPIENACKDSVRACTLFSFLGMQDGSRTEKDPI
jgi:hypothetical protein